EIQVAGHHDADARTLVLVKGWGNVERLFQNLGDDFLTAFAGVVEMDVVVAGLSLVGRPGPQVAHQRQQDGIAEAFPKMVVDMAIIPRFTEWAGAGRTQIDDDASRRFQPVPGDEGPSLALFD